MFLLVTTFFAACNTSKKSSSTVVIPPPSKEIVLEKEEVTPEVIKKPEIGKILQPLHIDFERVEMKGTMEMENKTEQHSFTFNIRMIKDSIIWMQLKKFGLEGARVLATKDSLFAVDRLHRTFMKKSWASIQTQMNAPIDFAVLYEILSGNPVYFNNGFDSLQTTEKMKYISSQNADKRAVSYTHLTLPTSDLV